MTQPDLAILLTGAARVVADRIAAAHEQAGIHGVRPAFGFVIRALTERPRTLTALAELLGVTKQAAIKVVDEMERQGLVQRTVDDTDRRSKVIALTDSGRRVRRVALSASRDMESELDEQDATDLRRALLRLLELNGALEDAAAGRSRAAGWG